MGPILDGNDGRRPSTALSGQRVHTLTPYGGRGLVILSRCHVYVAPWGVFGGCMHRVCTLACGGCPHLAIWTPSAAGTFRTLPDTVVKEA